MTVQTPARWQDAAEPVEAPDERMLSLGQVVSETGLRQQTILTAVHSSAHGSRRSRMRELAQPAFDVGGTPYWSRKQVSDYYAQIAARHSVREEFAHLPTVDAATAAQRGLLSLRGLSRASRVPLTTLHRWKTWTGFPAPAALMEVDSPTPRVLYPWAAFRDWVLTHRQRWLARHPEAVLPEAAPDGGDD